MKMVGHFPPAWIVIVKQDFWHAVEPWTLTSPAITVVSMCITRIVRHRNVMLLSLWEKIEIIVKVSSHRPYFLTFRTDYKANDFST